MNLEAYKDKRKIKYKIKRMIHKSRYKSIQNLNKVLSKSQAKMIMSKNRRMNHSLFPVVRNLSYQRLRNK